MARKAIRKETIRKNTIQSMRNLGTYKPEYNPIIDIYAGLSEQYEKLTKEFKDTNYNYSSPTGQGGDKKSSLIATLETLRKDILQYSDRLCLNPRSMMEEKNKGKKKESALTKALRELEHM